MDDKMIRQVTQFNESFGVEINTLPTHLDEETSALGIRLMREEVDEYEEAIENDDMVEIADALVDQLFILTGNVIKHGLQDVVSELFDEVYLSNMSKLEDGEVIRRDDNKILKGKFYFKPAIKRILEKKYGKQY